MKHTCTSQNACYVVTYMLHAQYYMHIVGLCILHVRTVWRETVAGVILVNDHEFTKF